MEKSNGDRIIVLVDMDCFYVQVEQKLCPEYQNKPCAVVQYKTWKGGGIIAVNYEARAKGVSRMLRGDEALKLCPDIHLFRVPEVRGKADLTRYREAGAEVLNIICKFSDCVERASIDEAYLDMTSVVNKRIQTAPPVTADQLPNTFVVGWENEDPDLRKRELEKWLQMIYEEDHLYNDRLLALTAIIVEEMRTAVYENTGYSCSAGIAHNKMLAKLSCGIHKPNKQTLLPQASIQLLFNTVPIKKVRNLGGKLGEEVVKKFNAEKMGDIFHVEKSQFISNFGEKTGHWLYNLSRGIENEPVIARQLPKSIGCGKNFPGKTSLSTKTEVNHWLKQLSLELTERLMKDRESNKRVAHLLTISIRTHENNSFSMVSRSCPIHVYDADRLANDAFLAITKLNTATSENLWRPTIWTLSMAASKFEEKLDNSSCCIQSYLVNSKVNSELNENVPYQKQKETSDLINISITKGNDASQTHFTKCKGEITSFFNKKHIFDPSMEEKSDARDENDSEPNLMLVQCCNAIDSLSEENISNNDVKNEKHNYSDMNSSDTLSKIQTSNASDMNLSNILSKKQTSNASDMNSSDTLSVNQTSSASDINTIDILSKNQTNPKMGFFARKLAERLKKYQSDTHLQNNTDFAINTEKSVVPGTLNKDSDNFPSMSVHGNSDQDYQQPTTSTEKDLQSPSDDNDVLLHLDPELTKLCDKCNKHIPVWEEDEHLDYHTALDLSKEFSMNTTTINYSVNKPSNDLNKPKQSKKRKNMTKSSVKSKKTFVQSNTLDTFFKHK